MSVGRAYEGIGCLETGLRLAQQHGLLATEIRARINTGGPLIDRDPRAAFEVSRVGLEQVRRFGHRQGESMLIGNSSAAAIATGEWEWARTEIRAGLEEARSEEERIVLLGFWIELRVEGGEDADAELDETDAWFAGRVADEPYLESAVANNRRARALQRGDLAAAAGANLEAGRLDPYNAVWNFGDAILMALLARERALLEESVGALRGTASHAAMARLAIRCGEAGMAALDGNLDGARGGLLEAYDELREIGAARRQALSGLVMATLLDAGDLRVRAAIEESRRLFERMGANLWLVLLDRALAAGRPVAADPVRSTEIGDAIPR